MVLSNIPPNPESSKTPQNLSQINSNNSNEEFPIPSCSLWFSFEEVNEIERRALPEFFESSAEKFKNPAVYKEYRDFMIKTFRMRPKEYLSVTTCRRYLTGDVLSIMKIHAFLEQWGLINYQVLEGPNGGIHAAQQSHLAKTLLNQESVLKCENEESVIISCKSCQGECSSSSSLTAYYHSPSNGINLCSSCFTNGKYSSEMSSADFVKIDPSSFAASTTSSSQDWSEEELLKLLEAVEKYSDSGVNMAANNVWDAIAESVGKSREACLIQFLKLPTSELLSRTTSQADSDFLSSSSSSVSSSVFINFPFSQSENPVLSVLAFLAGHVHPRVAAVASQAALAELSRCENIQNVDMQGIAATALACASAHAHNLATAESNRIAYWKDLLVETQLKKLQLKMESLEELERIVDEERKEIEKQRLQIFMERFNLRKMLLQSDQKAMN